MTLSQLSPLVARLTDAEHDRQELHVALEQLLALFRGNEFLRFEDQRVLRAAHALAKEQRAKSVIAAHRSRAGAPEPEAAEAPESTRLARGTAAGLAAQEDANVAPAQAGELVEPAGGDPAADDDSCREAREQERMQVRVDRQDEP